MRKLFTALTILSLALFVSCGKDSGPTGVAEKFLTHSSKGEFAEAKKYCDEPTGRLLGMAESMLPPEKLAELKGKELKIDMISEEIKEDAAVVKYKATGEGEDGTEKSVDLKKIDGDWKVAINKEGAQ